jgi:hypothetical protein
MLRSLNSGLLVVFSFIAAPLVAAEPFVWYRYEQAGPATFLQGVSGNNLNGTASGATFSPDRPPNAQFTPGVPPTAGSLVMSGLADQGGVTDAAGLLPIPMIQASGGYTMDGQFRPNSCTVPSSWGIQQWL